MKKCSSCKKKKQLKEFHKNSASPDGFQWACKQCQLVFSRRYKRNTRQNILDKLGHTCIKCGYKGPAIQIDHINGDSTPEKRIHGIGRGYSTGVLWNAVKANPKRFQVLCANCNYEKRIENKEA